MSLPLTKTAYEIFAPTTGGGAPRGPNMDDVRAWGGEIEGLLVGDQVFAAAFGIVFDNETDNGERLLAAVAKAKEFGVELRTSPGIAYSSIDIPDIHSIAVTGPGAVRIGTGRPWYAEANKRNTGFGALTFNTLYVNSATGNASNSGLAPEFAKPGVQNAVDILTLRGTPLQGYYEIQVARGVYPRNTQFFGVKSTPDLMVYVRGPAVDAWNNTTPPREGVAISAITSANPAVVTAAGHGYNNGDMIFIGLAARSGGMHAADGKMYLVANKTTDTIELNDLDGNAVNGTLWAAYTTGGKVYDCNGNAPKAIIYGEGNTSQNGWQVNTMALRAFDFQFIACGTKNNRGVAGIYAAIRADLRTENCHASDCGVGFWGREGTYIMTLGGRRWNCGAGDQALDARFTFGSANPGSAALTTTPIYQKCVFGVDCWEMSNGHADGAIFSDCSTEINVRKNSHCVAIYNRYINTGAAKAGLVVRDGGYLNEGNSVWTGSYKPRISRLANAMHETPAGETHYTWITKQVINGANNLTGTTTETTLLTQSIGQDTMNLSPQAFRVKLWASGGSGSGTIIVRMRLAGTQLQSFTIPLDGSNPTFNLEYEIEARANSFGSCRAIHKALQWRNSVTTPYVTVFTPTFDTSGGAQDLTITVQLSHASDSFLLMHLCFEALGW